MKEQKRVSGKIHSYETFGAADGPGLRFVLFLQGCNLRCKYCHNPDTWPTNAYSKIMSAEDVSKEIIKYKNYFGKKGGLTVSGGEPLLQPDFLIELFRLMKSENVHVAIDTSGAEYSEKDKRFETLLSLTDLVLLDIKTYRRRKMPRFDGQGQRADSGICKKTFRT